MATGGQRYCISRKGRLLDLEPWKWGDLPLVWDPDRHRWIGLDVTFGEHVDSVPITDQEAESFMNTGEISGLLRSGRMEQSDDSGE